MRRAAWAVTFLAFIALYLPFALMLYYSLQDAGGWTLKWYRVALSNRQTLAALETSLWVGAWSTLGATALGTLGALAMERAEFRGKEIFASSMTIPLVLPEIVMGLSLLLWFVMLKISLGTFCVILGHITFSLSYAFLSVRARLIDLDPAFEEAARDLGANARVTFRRVTLPLLIPAIFTGALIAFTVSFDDFLVTFFTSGVGSDTLPVRIYSMIKYGLSPEIHALSCLMILATLALVVFITYGRISVFGTFWEMLRFKPQTKA